MLAAVVSELGAPPRPCERPEPERQASQALVAVSAAPLNPIEIRVAAGRHARTPKTPYVPGLEGVGTVVEADGVEPGVRVRFEGVLPGFGTDGAMAELAAVPEEALVELPDEVDDSLAAAIGVVGITASLALERARLAATDRVLALGATGAVGQVAVQLAKLTGAGSVVAAGRSAERLSRARALGADETVELGGADERELAESFREAAGGDLNVVLDPLWGVPAMGALEAIATGGRLVNVGQSAGADVRLPLATLRDRQASLLGVSSGWMPLTAKLAAYRRVLEYATAGRVVVDREVIPLAEVAEAWRRQADSPGRKLVIAPRADARREEL